MRARPLAGPCGQGARKTDAAQASAHLFWWCLGRECGRARIGRRARRLSRSHRWERFREQRTRQGLAALRTMMRGQGRRQEEAQARGASLQARHSRA
jgi:hypothetical protein